MISIANTNVFSTNNVINMKTDQKNTLKEVRKNSIDKNESNFSQQSISQLTTSVNYINVNSTDNQK